MTDRIDYEDDNLDDVHIDNVELFRLEYMNPNTIWIRLYKSDGKDVVINLSSKSKIYGKHEIEDSDVPLEVSSKIIPFPYKKFPS